MIPVSKTQVRIEVLSDGISQLMQSAAMAAEVNSAASGIQQAAGPLFEVKPAEVRGDRVMALVVPIDKEGREAEARDKTLSKAVSACRS